MPKKQLIRESTATRRQRQKIFSQAGKLAVGQARAAGLTVTYAEGSRVIRESPNGEKVVIATIPEPIQTKEREIKLSVCTND